jgi:hypothetical protein
VLVPAADGGGGVSATWYDENYPYRRAVSVDNTAAGAGGTVDITFTMPVDDDLFWENVQADGDDIRICDADGFTLLTFDTASFNKTTRAGSFEVDAYAAPAGEMCVIYIYWGYASATDGRSSFVPASALTGYVDQRKPGPLVFEAAEERQAALRPRNVVAKSSLETKPVYLDFTRRMAKRADPYAARDLYEHPHHRRLDRSGLTDRGQRRGRLCPARARGDTPRQHLRRNLVRSRQGHR